MKDMYEFKNGVLYNKHVVLYVLDFSEITYSKRDKQAVFRGTNELQYKMDEETYRKIQIYFIENKGKS